MPIYFVIRNINRLKMEVMTRSQLEWSVESIISTINPQVILVVKETRQFLKVFTFADTKKLQLEIWDPILEFGIWNYCTITNIQVDQFRIVVKLAE